MKCIAFVLLAALLAIDFVEAAGLAEVSTTTPAAGSAGAPVAPPGGTLVGAPPIFGRDLLKKNNCTTACHALDRKVVGPAYYDVALRYKYEPAVAGKLRARVKAGGTGVWDKTIAMPPNPQVPDAEMMVMIAYILALKPPASYKPGWVSAGRGPIATVPAAPGSDRK